MLSQVCCPKFIGNLETHISRLDLWRQRFFFPFGSLSIRDGSEIRFWEDKWLGNATFREQYLGLYNIVRHKSDTLTKVLETSPPNVSS
jgi:hypothetical protein